MVLPRRGAGAKFTVPTIFFLEERPRGLIEFSSQIIVWRRGEPPQTLWVNPGE